MRRPGFLFHLGMHIAHPDKSLEKEFVEFISGILKEHKIIPAEILVQRDEIYSLLEPVAKDFNISLKMSKRLRASDTAYRSMVRFLRKNKQ